MDPLPLTPTPHTDRRVLDFALSLLLVVCILGACRLLYGLVQEHDEQLMQAAECADEQIDHREPMEAWRAAFVRCERQR